ncbi:hypothetical protein H6P81_020731 [Aristolochia fimbriata]|uniref:Uncharacterized protein n=1 Tax=Aristolochia fimbriata TaxID=158543 RepID=A0AAV7DY79_ARIFI|nr:hypothetical protein H6P81_020731 [Aristolochia fimbriata]
MQGMDAKENENELLNSRIQQLERERDELRKDIEQLCLQQAGPSYLAVATRMHFQRTAGLEQEIENLQKKLVACTRDNHNLQEELSEVYRIKGHLADLHNTEVTKNVEAEKQLKFFQGSVASAFAERDKSIMEAEKAKEREETMARKFEALQNRIEELTRECTEARKLNTNLQINATKLREENDLFGKVIDKFYEIRQTSLRSVVDGNRHDKCECLLRDPSEMWCFDDHGGTSTSKYITSLEIEVERSRISIDSLQNKLRVGLEIEEYLRKRISALQERQINSVDMIRPGVSLLKIFHKQHKQEVVSLLEQEKDQIDSIVCEIRELMMQTKIVSGTLEALQSVKRCEDVECRDVHVNAIIDPVEATKGSELSSSKLLVSETTDTSDALSQALQGKVAALLLLSQQEERHLLEREVNAALQRKMDELQRNLLQVTNEKVKALMELAQVRKEYQQLQESIGHGMKLENSFVNSGEKGVAPGEKLKGLLKRTYLRRWMGQANLHGDESSIYNEESSKKLNSSDFARLKVENATLHESMTCIEHLTTSIHRLRVSLLKAKDALTSSSSVGMITQTLDNIISEAKLIRTALGSSLPVSWSAEAEFNPQDGHPKDPPDNLEDAASEKLDTVSAAGLEMVELLVLAAELEKLIALEWSLKTG